MRTKVAVAVLGLGLVSLAVLPGDKVRVNSAPGYRLIGWNDLGMHCMDSDYSVLSILPPSRWTAAPAMARTPSPPPSPPTVG